MGNGTTGTAFGLKAQPGRRDGTTDDEPLLPRPTSTGQAWEQAARELGDRAVDRARRAEQHGHLLSARSWYLAGSACYRFGQVPCSTATR